jgi:hypothetical protein
VTPFAGSRPSNLLHELSATVSRWSLWEVRWGREGEGEGRCIVAWGEVAAGGQESEVDAEIVKTGWRATRVSSGFYSSTTWILAIYPRSMAEIVQTFRVILIGPIFGF